MRGVWCGVLYSTIIKRHFLQVPFFEICAGRASRLRLLMRCGQSPFGARDEER